MTLLISIGMNFPPMKFSTIILSSISPMISSIVDTCLFFFQLSSVYCFGGLVDLALQHTAGYAQQSSFHVKCTSFNRPCFDFCGEYFLLAEKVEKLELKLLKHLNIKLDTNTSFASICAVLPLHMVAILAIITFPLPP